MSPWHAFEAKWREDMDRIAEAIGYPKGADYGDILGRIDELQADHEQMRNALDSVRQCDKCVHCQSNARATLIDVDGSALSESSDPDRSNG